jgi:hypothetical protein
MDQMLRRLWLVSWILLVPAGAGAQSMAPHTTSDAPKPEPQARPTGLPTRLSWTFNFDAGWGTFGFGNSLYRNPREPGVADNLSDQWFEGYVKPSLSGAYTFGSSSQAMAKSAPWASGRTGPPAGLRSRYLVVRRRGPRDRVAVGQSVVDRRERD